MEFTEKESRLWSRMGPRAVFGLGLNNAASVYPDLMVLSADVRSSAGLEPFKRNFPDQYLDVGIAEQNMIGIAAGLASEGYRVVTTTFAPFQAMRCCEQIRVNLGYMKYPVVMAGLGSGLVLGVQGFTHCCFEDIGVLRSIPNLTLISPADTAETVKALFAALEWKRPVYLRLTGGVRMPIVYHNDYQFEIGKGIRLYGVRSGKIGIIASGASVAPAIEAAKMLEETGLSAQVVNMHTIKPLDIEIVQQLCKNCRMIVTVEEHNIIGGLGSAVAEFKSTLNNAPPQLFIGIDDRYIKPGSYEYLLDQYGLSAEKIAEKIKAAYQENE